MQEKTLGDYRIIKQMGKGSLGAVYLSEHRFIKKQYILKVLPEELSRDHAFLRRFESHIAQIAALDHPHIVKVHNVSFIEGLYVLVTDCVIDAWGESTNLSQWIASKKESLNEGELLSVLRQIAGALDYAHAQSMIHGSLKLSNILVNKSEQNLHIMLSDFGLFSIVGDNTVVARSMKTITDELSCALSKNSHSSSEKERYIPFPIEGGHASTLSQSFLQSFAFFAPEQKRMAPASIKTDSYAFAVLAYYLISGFFPEGIFPMPSEMEKKYHFDFDSLIKSCLAFHPERRPVHLLPLLEEKIVESFSSSIVTRDLPEDVVNVSVPHISEKKESAKSIESTTATVLLEKKGVMDPIEPPKLNALKEESYSQALKAMLNRDPIVTHYQPQKKKADNAEPIPTNMVVIAGGRYLRGSNEGARDEVPRHHVILRSFAMDIHPITNEQFVRFLEYMGGEKDKNYHDLIRLKESRLYRSAGNLSIESGYANHPVVGVTWYGAVAYAEWVNKRLPTEAEWEAAACGGIEDALYPSGMSIEKSQANFFSSDTTPVKSYAPNPYGLYDMAGNVYEWCQDWYGYNYYETSINEPNQPEGPSQGVYRVLRGGCWKSLKEDLRVAHRHRNNPGTLNGTYGFRCASDI